MPGDFKIFQIEVSNHCSLTCAYCPHPKQKRSKGYMSFDTFEKCVALFRKSANKMNLLHLHNFGEPLLHPGLEKLIAHAASFGIDCSFATNGVDHAGNLFPKERWRAIRDAGVRSVYFSAHKVPEEEFIDWVKDYVDVVGIFRPNPKDQHTWAGQTRGKRQLDTDVMRQPCFFEQANALTVQWTGKISTCCVDIEGQRQGLTIDDVLERGYQFEKIPLCNSCDLMRFTVDI